MRELYNLNITQEVTQHFNAVLLDSKNIDEDNVMSRAKETLSKFQNHGLDEFVVEHMETLEKMMQMLSDERWKTSSSDKKFILSALQYFTQEDDLIPDDIPKIGLLDDCIMIDIVEQKIKEKMQAYKEYVSAAKIYGKNKCYSTKDWKETQRKELFSRIRHRRLRNQRR